MLNVASGPPRPSNFCYFLLFYYFCVDSIYFVPLKLYYCHMGRGLPADSSLDSSIQLIPFPFCLVTWSAVCHMTELSGGRVVGGLAGHVECIWSVQVLGTAHAW